MQIANSFDAHTNKKIIKSFLLSLLPGLVAFLQMYQTTDNLKQSALAGVLVFLTPFVPNTVHEYVAGKKEDA